MPERVALIGSGNWGSAIATVMGPNAEKHDMFETKVNMWVFEEQIDGKNLTEIINETNENVKYLPGIKLPKNIYAEPDLEKAVTGATMMVFVIPHQFLPRTVPNMKNAFDPKVIGCSLIKGIEFKESKPILISDLIKESMSGIDMSVLMGANVANEVAKGDFSESTVGCTSKENGEKWKMLFNRPCFKVAVCEDVAGAELCGALKNVVALGAGFCDGLGYGGNTKAAIIRIGLMEMQKFCEVFYGERGIKSSTFLESCGVADLITTCFGGRNRKCAEEFASKAKAGTPVTWEDLEKEMLNGQKLQGTITSKDVMECLEKADAKKDFPLFCTIYDIAFGGASPEKIVDF